MEQLTFSKLELNKPFYLGDIILSEQEIMDYAQAFDPLEFHTNKEAAAKSHFKGLVASGSHVFTLIHRTKWIPVFGKTVLAGLEVNNWKFLKPIYPNQKITSTVTITAIKPNTEKHYATVTWFYEFKNEQQELLQVLEMIVLHKQ